MFRSTNVPFDQCSLDESAFDESVFDESTPHLIPKLEHNNIYGTYMYVVIILNFLDTIFILGIDNIQNNIGILPM